MKYIAFMEVKGRRYKCTAMCSILALLFCKLKLYSNYSGRYCSFHQGTFSETFKYQSAYAFCILHLF